MGYKKFKKSRGLFKLPSNKIPLPEPTVLEQSELCSECRKKLTKKQIRWGCRTCSYKCSNRRKARLFFTGMRHKKRSKVPWDV